MALLSEYTRYAIGIKKKKVVPKFDYDSKIPEQLLYKIKSKGLVGTDLVNMKKTIVVQLESGIPPEELFKFVDQYAALLARWKKSIEKGNMPQETVIPPDR